MMQSLYGTVWTLFLVWTIGSNQVCRNQTKQEDELPGHSACVSLTEASLRVMRARVGTPGVLYGVPAYLKVMAVTQSFITILTKMGKMCGQYAKMSCGVILVLMVDAIWVCASYIVQFIYSLESADSHINASNTSVQDKATPYLLTTVANSLFIVYMPIAAILHCAASTTNQHKADPLIKDNKDENNGFQTHNSTDDENANLLRKTDPVDVDTASMPEKKLLPRSDDESANNNSCCGCLHAGSSKLTQPIICRNAKWAFITCWFWFGANFSYNWSLQHTSVSSNTIISSSCVRACVQSRGRFMGYICSHFWCIAVYIYPCMCNV